MNDISKKLLDELPKPPEGKVGWPWTEASLPNENQRFEKLPSISLVTPSFNQGIYLEETIRSILLQGYPNLEYYIIDGGSTDDSIEIIHKYEPWLSGWVSEKDRGQSDAINKGFARCSGEIFNWICSDDLLTDGALWKVAEAFSQENQCDVLAGGCYCQYDKEPAKSEVRSAWQEGWEKIPYYAAIWQPSCFFRRALVNRSVLLLNELQYCMDRELWCYFYRQNANWKWTEEVLSHYRFTGENKSMTGKNRIIDEISTIYQNHVKESIPLPKLLSGSWLPLTLASLRGKGKYQRYLSRFFARGISAGLLLFYPKEHVRALQKEFYIYSVW